MSKIFGEIDQYFDPGLTLTVRGRQYVVPLPSAKLGLYCRRLAEATGELSEASTDEEIRAAVARVAEVPGLDDDRPLPEQLLGSAYEEMVRDAVPDPHIQYCGTAAYLWVIGGEDMAARWWQSGGRPEALGPVPRAQRRAETRGNGTGAATATRSPGSTNGMRSQRKAKPKASRGERS